MGIIRALRLIVSTSKGFSLIDITVGAGIIMGVALTSAKLFQTQRFAQRKTELDQKLSFYHQALTKILGMAENCNATLKKNFAIASPISAIDVPTLWSCDKTVSGFCSFSAGQDRTNGVYIDPNAFPGKKLISVDDHIDETRTWKVCEMKIVEGRATSGLVKLRIGYCLDPKIRDYKVFKEVYLNTRFSNGNFAECLDNKETTTANLQDDLCKNIGGSVSSGGSILEWDPVAQACKAKTTSPCQAGEIVVGIGADGKPKCQTASSSNNASGLGDTSPTPTCSGSQKPTLTFDIATGKVKIICQ